ncbi:hypothetical protein Tco_0596696 [Tanacetum coccineum]
MTHQRLHTDYEVCMYALTVSTIEPNNIKEAMADHSWIESMQDELNQFDDFKFGNCSTTKGRMLWLSMLGKNNSVIAISCNSSPIFEDKATLTSVIIMAQQQQHANVDHELCVRQTSDMTLWMSNKKVELEHVQCTIFWHTLKEDGSKHRLKICLNRKELHLSLDDSEQSSLRQANDNNHGFVYATPPSFSNMVPVLQTSVMGFTMELKTVSYYKISGLYRLADVMQDILQVLDYTRYGMGPTAVADNANVILLCQ